MELSPTVNTLIDVGMWTCFALLGLALLGLVGFAIMQIVDNPQRSLTALIGVVGLVAIFFLAYVLSSSTDLSPIVYEKTGTPESWGRWVGAGLFTTYFLFGATVLSLVAVEVMRPFKK